MWYYGTVKGGVFVANETIKATAKESGVFLWEIAERLQMSDSSLSRKLRRELSDGERERVLAAIDAIKSNK